MSPSRSYLAHRHHFAAFMFLFCAVVIGCGGAGGGGGRNLTAGSSVTGGSTTATTAGSTTGTGTTGGSTTGTTDGSTTGTTDGSTTGTTDGSTTGTTDGSTTGTTDGSTTGTTDGSTTGTTDGSTTGTTGGTTGGGGGGGSDYVVFSAESGGTAKLYKMTLPTGIPQEIPTQRAAWEPEVSADGTRIVYTERGFSDHLRLLNTTTGAETTLDQNNYDAFAGAISPDKSFIVYTNNKDFTLQLYRVSASGAGRTALTSFDNGAAFARFSPDGAKLVFVSGVTSDDIYKMNVDGSSVQILTSIAADESHPAFSPDGTRIVFTENTGTFESPRRRIMIMSSTGASKRSLTGGADDTDPVFTPDGTKVLFTRLIGASRELYMVNADGSGLQQLTTMGAIINRPSCYRQ